MGRVKVEEDKDDVVSSGGGDNKYKNNIHAITVTVMEEGSYSQGM